MPKEHLCFDVTFGNVVFCKREAKDNSEYNKVRRNKFLKGKKTSLKVNILNANGKIVLTEMKITK